MMGGLSSALRSRWFFSFLGVALLGALVWFAGPLIGIGDARPLEDDAVRLAVILAALLAWAAALAVSILRKRRRAAAMVQGIAALSPDEPAAATAEEIATLQERLNDALDRLRRNGKGAGAIYDLPWYVLIGPPGSGKTTALLNAGLRFPLATDNGPASVRGVGGTRNCDWWFADEAVLLDTAGRYTTQDSHAEVDAGAWLGFLDLLKRTRPRQPVNGALVAISLAELGAATPAVRNAHAAAVRQRLNQLYERLGVRLPVYVLFTKLDLVVGFTEFFADLGKEGREQVWGVTLPLEEARPLDRLPADFDALTERLQARVLERLNAESLAERRNLVFGFPAQFASLKEPVADFLTAVFQPSRYEPRLMLRGVYFTSATQTGAPIDRLMAAMAGTFGLTAPAPAGAGPSGRSFFLTRLLSDVVFGEAGLVGRDPQVESRNRWVRRGAWAAAALVTLAGIGASALSYMRNTALAERVEAELDQTRALLGTSDGDPAVLGEQDRILDVLDRLRGLNDGPEGMAGPTPVTMRFGLHQGEKLSPAADEAYHRALDHLFYPHLLLRMEYRLRGAMDRPDLLYEGLKAYLMLGGMGRKDGPAPNAALDAALVRDWMMLEWATAYQGAANEPVRARLAAHLDALLAKPPMALPLDMPLVEQARATLLREAPAARAYRIIRRAAEEKAPPDWRVIDHAGPAGAQVFVRRSGQPLTAGTPGLFTHKGFHDAFLPNLGRVAERIAGDAWVLGPQTAAAGRDGVARIQNEVLTLYYNEFARNWDGLLADLSLAQFRSMDEAATVLNAAAGPMSPVRTLVQAVARETDLATAPPAANPVETAQQAAGQTPAGQRLAGLAEQFGLKTGGKPGQPVSDRYQTLRDLAFGRNGGPAGLDQVLASLDSLYQQVSRVAGLPGQGEGDKAAAVRLGQQLAATSATLPEPLRSWIGGMGQQTSAAALGSLRTQINTVWQSSVVPFCERAVKGRYPLQPGSRNEAAVDDFARLFAPTGLIDSFFTANLKPYVDTTRQPWRWQRIGGMDLDLSEPVLEQFRRAATIREAFFATGSPRPDVKFTLTPRIIDPKIETVEIDLEGQLVTFQPGVNRGVTVQWPMPISTNVSAVTFVAGSTNGVPNKVQARSASGPWSVFRLFREARFEPRGPDRAVVTFAGGGMSASFELRASSIVNPFSLPDMEQFQCPPTL
ncbi:type VI secretion system membrane subunit TssM [Azospirillum rugosum]|uniref:Type VI secretion system protein ImpL n=1 Tax=Azospirillum rugosum TaxID=416170 RepID=A0ABS4SKX7_9PROT|nr:type VI secretion system membrane subunit TssM [Azospirillum rugosum]MBP2293223.1 type VI secretion system protein ImpL [Azospirillum rugosum]